MLCLEWWTSLYFLCTWDNPFCCLFSLQLFNGWPLGFLSNLHDVVSSQYALIVWFWPLSDMLQALDGGKHYAVYMDYIIGIYCPLFRSKHLNDPSIHIECALVFALDCEKKECIVIFYICTYWVPYSCKFSENFKNLPFFFFLTQVDIVPTLLSHGCVYQYELILSGGAFSKMEKCQRSV